ncbi:MAG TPA: hypothetical protein VLI04_16580 [Nocardioidaceae bacterium]|nr:hypothetical protein [Nocardioidaceae bacterium]
MRRLLVAVGALVSALVLGGGGFIVTRAPNLGAVGDGQVESKQKSAVFTIADRTIRQVRYDDRATMRYTFTLRNDAWYDVKVNGLKAEKVEQTLLKVKGLTDVEGHSSFSLESGEERRVVLAVQMTDCERLSARASSLIESVRLRVTGLAGMDHEIALQLPEELRTGSAREMFCPFATAKSRPPG